MFKHDDSSTPHGSESILFPNRDNWLTDAIRRNLLPIWLRYIPFRELCQFTNGLIDLGFTRLSLPGLGFKIPPFAGMSGRINVRTNSGSERTAVYGRINLSPFASVIAGNPNWGKGTRRSLDGAENYLSIEVTESAGYPIIRSAMCRSLSYALLHLKGLLGMQLEPVVDAGWDPQYGINQK